MTGYAARSLRPPELRAALLFAEEVLTIGNADGAPEMLAAVSGLVGADAATLTRLDLASGHELVVMWPPERARIENLNTYAQESASHPLRRPLAQLAQSGRRERRPVRISDVLGRREWRRSPLSSTSHRGVDDQMSVLIGAQQQSVQAITLSRYRGSFTDRQAHLLTVGQAHLTAAVHRAGRQPRPMLQLSPQLRWLAATIGIPSTGTAPGADGRPTAHRHSHHGQSADAPTRRQRQILSMVAQGLTDAQIGTRLGVSSTTVSKHLSRAYSRMGVANRAAAVQVISRVGQLPTGRGNGSARPSVPVSNV